MPFLCLPFKNLFGIRKNRFKRILAYAIEEIKFEEIRMFFEVIAAMTSKHFSPDFLFPVDTNSEANKKKNLIKKYFFIKYPPRNVCEKTSEQH